jgi:hypothetical protein
MRRVRPDDFATGLPPPPKTLPSQFTLQVLPEVVPISALLTHLLIGCSAIFSRAVKFSIAYAADRADSGTDRILRYVVNG